MFSKIVQNSRILAVNESAKSVIMYFYDIFRSEHKKETIEIVGSGNHVWYRCFITSDIQT